MEVGCNCVEYESASKHGRILNQSSRELISVQQGSLMKLVKKLGMDYVYAICDIDDRT